MVDFAFSFRIRVFLASNGGGGGVLMILLSPPLFLIAFSHSRKKKRRGREQSTPSFPIFGEREIGALLLRSVSLRKKRIFYEATNGIFSWGRSFLLFFFVFCSFPSFLEVSFFPIFFGRFFHRHFGNRSVVTHVRFPVSYALSVLIWENRSYTQPPFAQKLT